jgi:imidazolonepropionase-like amidohydrolase
MTPRLHDVLPSQRTLFAVLTVATLACLPRCSRPQADDAGDASAAGPGDAGSAFSFTHVTVIDVTGGPPLSDVTVSIAGNRIVGIAPSATGSPAGIAVDATGKFLIPGLWDMHVHWADEEYLTTFTANGITGIRLMNGFPMHLEWRKHVDTGVSPGPRMRIAGPLVDGAKPTYPPLSIAVATPDDARNAVRTTKSTGYDFVKPYSGLSRDAFFALADECKQQQIPFAGHVPDGVGADEFAQQGGTSIEHLREVPLACSNLAFDPNNPPDVLTAANAYDPGKAAAVFALFKQTSTWQCPTLVVSRKQLAGNPTLLDEPNMAYLPPSIQAYYRTLTLTPVRPPDQANALLSNERTIVAGMQQAGVALLAGTDAPTYGVFPGEGLHEELALLVDAGLSPLQALQTATLNPARFQALDGDLGVVAEGKLADLVLLDANPLVDIHNTTKINAVVENGNLFLRTDLDAMLADLKSKAANGVDSHPWPH